jgi:hypothetical protein
MLKQLLRLVYLPPPLGALPTIAAEPRRPLIFPLPAPTKPSHIPTLPPSITIIYHYHYDTVRQYQAISANWSGDDAPVPRRTRGFSVSLTFVDFNLTAASDFLPSFLPSFLRAPNFALSYSFLSLRSCFNLNVRTNLKILPNNILFLTFMLKLRKMAPLILMALNLCPTLGWPFLHFKCPKSTQPISSRFTLAFQAERNCTYLWHSMFILHW